MTNLTVNCQPQILLLASRYDLTCDYVVAQLRRRSVSYLRLNSEELSNSNIELDPVGRRLVVERQSRRYCVTPQCLRSVFFRRPVFLRDYGDDNRASSERFSRFQWASFVRNLILFTEARWINHPVATYKAEHKALQLSVAAELGFAVPETRVTNAPCSNSLDYGHERVALKGLDTVLVRDGGFEMFGFTTFDNLDSLDPGAWRSAPGIVQAALENKLDIRVTVVGDRIFPISITASGEAVAGDWRAQKGRAEFRRCELPVDTADRCRLLVEKLGLTFGGIDLALCDGEYFFLEVNPTGEWAWLVDSANVPIDKAISDALCVGSTGICGID